MVASVRGFLLVHHYLRVILQFFETTIRHDVPGMDAFDGSNAALDDAGLEVAYLRGVILNQVDIGGLTVVLDGRGGNQGDTPERLHEQPGVDELVGKKSAVLV